MKTTKTKNAVKEINLRTYFVYALADPRTGEVRYVGCTADLERRFSDHCAASYDSSTYAWCRELASLGLEPVLVCLQATIDFLAAQELEWDLMTQWRDSLLNRSRKHYHPTFSKPQKRQLRTRRFNLKKHLRRVAIELTTDGDREETGANSCGTPASFC